MEVSYRPGCYVWNPYPKPDETVTWTGACADGLAEGTGTQTWSYSVVQETGTGLPRSGRAHGTWDFVFSLPDGSSIERQIEFDNGTQVR